MSLSSGNLMLGLVPTLYTTSDSVASIKSPASSRSLSSGVVTQPRFSRRCPPTRPTVYGWASGPKRHAESCTVPVRERTSLKGAPFTFARRMIDVGNPYLRTRSIASPTPPLRSLHRPNKPRAYRYDDAHSTPQCGRSCSIPWPPPELLAIHPRISRVSV